MCPTVAALVLLTSAAEAPATTDPSYAKEEPSLIALYERLHEAPELSLGEVKTAAALAAELRARRFEVTTGVGGHGVVGVLRNGEGPVLLLRTDMDALPVEERTGLEHASKVVAKDRSGRSVPVMHACAHDLHMTAWVGAARVLAASRDRWAGTLVLIAQPAEELGVGARQMLSDGLFRRFPRPAYALALHTSADLPSGVVGYTPEYAMAAVDGVDVTVVGRGGHGAYPHRTIDPVVIAARIVLTLQAVVAREVDPVEAAVVTVGTIHGGNKRNVIPDEVKLELTVRSFRPDIRKHLIDAIRRVADAESMAAGAPRPRVEVRSDEGGHGAVYNDPKVGARVAAAVGRVLGDDRVRRMPPVMGGEDFSEYGAAGVPSVLLWIGAVEPKRFEQASAGGEPLPSLHSALFAPDLRPALRTAVTTLVSASLDLLGKR
jgi:hippurate hydrolase